MSCFGFTGSPALIEDTNVTDRIEEVFPGAIRSPQLAAKVKDILFNQGYIDTKTLLATSLCCDEVNRELENDLISKYKENFSMGGLAGFAFGGVTSFGAMAHHIPDGGNCFVVYGPHVGVDKEGNVGKVNRRGRGVSGACCGSAAAASNYVCKVYEGGSQSGLPTDALDAQQNFVGNMLLPQAARIAEASEPEVELPYALFDVQDDFMHQIVEKGCGEVAGKGKIALLGGIQINTPSGTHEYFLPKVFEIRNNKGEKVKDLMKFLL
jgi:hypothetical protein